MINASGGDGAVASGREIKLDPDPSSVRKARDFVRRSLRDLGFPGSVDDGVLVVSELVTNSVRAAPQAPCVVVVRIGGGQPVIEVHDGSPAFPKMRDPDFVAERGRGLYVVEACCESWDCVQSDDGKAIIAKLRR